MKTPVLLLALVVMSCANGETGPGNLPDSGTTEPCSEQKLQCGASCADPLSDPANCGECGRVCGVGECHNGLCRCRIDSDCGGGEQCRFNLCRASDPRGDRCLDDSECGTGRICAAGSCTTSICEAEKCDGWDNDCDGLADEYVDTVRPCYTGPKGTEGVGECHGGLDRCVSGRYVCEGQQIPVPETGLLTCDGKDNSCDGCIDGAGGTLGCDSLVPPYFDFVFLIDVSGSMSDNIAATIAATDRFTSQFAGRDRIHFGIMQIGTSPETPPFMKVTRSLTDWAAFKDALDMTWANDAISFEPGYDAIHDISMGVYDAELGFRPGSMRILIMLTDEKAQSYMSTGLTEAAACAPVIANDVMLSVVTLPKFYSSWDTCATGRTFPLDPDIEAVVKNLNSILILPCFEAP